MYLFDQDITITPIGPARYSANISEDWSINGNPNGGYLLALMANAMMQASDKKGTPILTINYLARSMPGPVEIEVAKMAESTQFSRMQAGLFQDGQEKIRALGTFSVETDECFILRYEKSPPDIAPLDTCMAIPELPGYTLYRQLDVRLDPACGGWMEGRLTDKSEHRGWLTFKDGRPFDLLSVALAADALPPPIFASQGMAAWVPTIELSVNIRNIPQTRWLKCVFRTCFVNCGLLEADGELRDGNDELVAISRQIAQYRVIGARPAAGR
ncbi:MAG: thioesterase family protein [Desulfobacteraceae bacterium]|jgi:hypothetical protein|nr:MAG: thioesterase family protein [Desulfobacteraceae bacterium]